MFKKTMKGTLIATAVAGLFSCASTQSPADNMVKPKEAAKVANCAGINECAGKGSCAGADNACKAQNSCKGKGWVETTEDDCKAKGGTVVAGM